MTTTEDEQRDELAQIIYRSGYPDPASDRIQPLVERSPWERGRVYWAADAILAAGYRKPRTITTVEELDALPASSVVLDAEELPLERFNNGTRACWTWGYEMVTPQLPATVLHAPEAEVGA